MDNFDHMTENVGNSHSFEELMGNSNSFDPWEFHWFRYKKFINMSEKYILAHLSCDDGRDNTNAKVTSKFISSIFR